MALIAYNRKTMLEADLVMWEVDYVNGSTVKEANGIRYEDLNRGQIKKFRLVAPGEVLIEVATSPSTPGTKFVYRRRTVMGPQGRKVVFVVGFAPMGPIWVVDPQTKHVEMDSGFKDADARKRTPAPLPYEGISELEMRGVAL
jgi:hypothetical protein